MLFDLIKFGRIEDIISAIKVIYNTDDITKLSATQKLDTLCECLRLTPNEFDQLIALHSPVMRTVRGHTFEVAFEYILKKEGYDVQDAGGDTGTDLIVNGYKLQLKTPNKGGTTHTHIEYKTHKTHGRKSGKESIEYYHRVDEFADFFVGFVSYQPLNIFIIPKEELPRHDSSSLHIKSPFKIPLNSPNYLNNFDLINVKLSQDSCNYILPGENEILPLTSKEIGMTSDIILNAILRESNFRIWDMSIRGFSREIALKKMLNDCKLPFSDPKLLKKIRGDKCDLAVSIDESHKFVQVKGVSLTKCVFGSEFTIIATETQLTRGKVNDHPTLSRLYLKTDFDHLLLSLDPPISYQLNKGAEWRFYLIPTDELKEHPQIHRRIKPIQSFPIAELDKYELNPENIVEMFRR